MANRDVPQELQRKQHDSGDRDATHNRLAGEGWRMGDMHAAKPPVGDAAASATSPKSVIDAIQGCRTLGALEDWSKSFAERANRLPKDQITNLLDPKDQYTYALLGDKLKTQA